MQNIGMKHKRQKIQSVKQGTALSEVLRCDQTLQISCLQAIVLAVARKWANQHIT